MRGDDRPDWMRRCAPEIPPTDEELILWARWFAAIVAVTAVAVGAMGYLILRRLIS